MKLTFKHGSDQNLSFLYLDSQLGKFGTLFSTNAWYMYFCSIVKSFQCHWQNQKQLIGGISADIWVWRRVCSAAAEVTKELGEQRHRPSQEQKGLAKCYKVLSYNKVVSFAMPLSIMWAKRILFILHICMSNRRLLSSICHVTCGLVAKDSIRGSHGH